MSIRNLVSVTILAVLCAVQVGCSKQRLATSPKTDRKVSVVFNIDGEAAVKGAVAGEGDRVESLDLMVYRVSDGMLEAYKRVDGGLQSLRASITADKPMRWYIVANAPASALDAFWEESSFLSAVTRLEDTGSTTMVMHAEGTDTFRTGENSVDTHLFRYASKVTVKDVTVDWLGDFSTVPSCRLQTVALVNAVGTTPYSGTPTALAPSAGGVWYNRSTVDATLTSPLDGLLVWKTGKDISSTSPVSCDIELYTMPNPSTADLWATDMPWSVRRTRVAVEIIIDGVPNWYAIDLPAMEGNTHYMVKNLVIKGPGMSSPDEKLVRTPVSFTLSVKPWGDEPHTPDFGVDD